MINYLILTISLGLIIFHVLTRYTRKARLYRKIPGPYPYPIIGNVWMFNVQCLHDMWNVMRKITREYYPISSMWSFTTALINVHHPDDLEILLSSQKTIEKGYMYEYLHPWLKTGLLTSTGDKWRQRRKILTPSFHFSILKKYIDITNEQSQKLIKNLKSGNKEQITDLVPFCSEFTLNIICESAMGVNLDKVNKQESDQYKKAVHDYGKIVMYRIPRPYIETWMMPFVYKMGALQRKSVKILHEFTEKVIKSRKEYHQNTQNKYLNDLCSEMEDIDIGRKKRLAMLDLLLKEQQNGQIDDEGIKEEVDTFLFEGHDTTGMAMTYTLLLLAENKEAQDRARAEVTELLDKTEGNITDAQELPYLERCIKESLRLFPPVATILRKVTGDLQLKHAFVPAGTTVIVQLFDTHRDPNFWSDPEKFDPDRFLSKNCQSRHPYAYIPFSAGPRNCIGQKFAMMELKSLIAQLLYNFYFEPIDRIADLKLIADIVLRPLNSMKIKLIKINE